jgi:hypothetical protein
MLGPHTSLTPAGRLTVALSVLLGLLGLLGLGLLGLLRGAPSPHDAGPPRATEESHTDREARRQDPSMVTVTAPTARSIAMLPTVTPPRARATAAPRAEYAAPARPTLDPHRSRMALPTVPPAGSRESARTGCDPAYPEERTCIPPGPPLAQPCAITNERNFTVLPPDPRGLDRDRDGIGCEPIGP